MEEAPANNAKAVVIFKVNGVTIKDSNNNTIKNTVNNGVADSIPNQEGVVDTIKASVSFINGTGGGDDTTTLICTAFVIIAALGVDCNYKRAEFPDLKMPDSFRQGTVVIWSAAPENLIMDPRAVSSQKMTWRQWGLKHFSVPTSVPPIGAAFIWNREVLRKKLFSMKI